MATATTKTRILVGELAVSCVVTAVDMSSQANPIERTSLCDADKAFILGKSMYSLSVSAMFDNDTAAGSYWAEMVDNFDNGTLLPVLVGPAGVDDGDPVWLAEAWQQNYSISSDADGAVDATYTFEVTGPAEFGHVLDDATTAVTADGNSAVYDGGAESTNGGVAHLHVTAVGGTTPTNDVTIEHSVNGSTGWATLATFTQVGGSPTAERVVVAAGTTVRRYLRVAHDVGGTSPSYTLAVAFARS